MNGLNAVKDSPMMMGNLSMTFEDHKNLLRLLKYIKSRAYKMTKEDFINELEIEIKRLKSKIKHMKKNICEEY